MGAGRNLFARLVSVARAEGAGGLDLGRRGWRPRFIDYLYLGFTNDSLQADRSHAARPGRRRDGGSVARLARHPRARHRTGRERVHVTVSPICLRFDRARCVRVRWRHGRSGRDIRPHGAFTDGWAVDYRIRREDGELHAGFAVGKRRTLLPSGQQTLTLLRRSRTRAARLRSYAELVESPATRGAALISIWFDPADEGNLPSGQLRARSRIGHSGLTGYSRVDGSGRRDEAHDPLVPDGELSTRMVRLGSGSRRSPHAPRRS